MLKVLLLLLTSIYERLLVTSNDEAFGVQAVLSAQASLRHGEGNGYADANPQVSSSNILRYYTRQQLSADARKLGSQKYTLPRSDCVCALL